MQRCPILKEIRKKKLQTHLYRLVPLIYHKKSTFFVKIYILYILLFSNSLQTILLIKTLYTKIFQI